jgi:hypothetical protein
VTSSTPKSRLRIGFAVVAIAVVAFSLTAVTAPSGADQPSVVTGTATVEADATVSSLRPDTPLGSEPWLRADLLPERHAFLRFALPHTDGVLTAATLRIWVRDDSGGFGVASVLGDWDESTVTLTTAPLVGPAFAEVGPSGEATWVEIPVPVELASQGTISLALVGASEQKSELASREAQRPPLLDYTLTPPDPGGSPGVTGSTGATGPAPTGPAPTGPAVTGPVPTGPTAAPSTPETPSPTEPAPTQTPTATPSTAPSQPAPPTTDPTIVAAGDIACAPGSSSFDGGAARRTSATCSRRANWWDGWRRPPCSRSATSSTRTER